MELILSILCLILIAVIIFFYISLQKAFKRIRFFENHFIGIAQLVTLVQSRLSYLDKQGRFSSDDEIGFAFESIKGLWKILINAGLRTVDEKGKNQEPEESNFQFPEASKNYFEVPKQETKQ